MSEIRVDKVIDEAGTGAVELTQGATIPSGKTLSGSGSLNLSGSVNATALTGTPNITVANVVGAAATFSGNVSVGGVLTYSDVTNIDSVGLVTARTGVRVNAGGVVVTAGISTFKGAHFNGGLLKEKANVVATRLSDVSGSHVDLENGMTHVYTQNEDGGGASLAINLRVSSSIQLMDRLSVGETISVNIVTKPNNAGYIDEITVDGAAVTEEWNGGSAPSSANNGGFDMTTIQITRIASTGTENTDLLVQCNQSNFA
jgi:hypothetical protein|tara:strand:- start:1143 stop:1916 length:774 start_codon:yes stop_codon:yes gene_type:complete